jgi:DNA transposition AAA+ family ATPase
MPDPKPFNESLRDRLAAWRDATAATTGKAVSNDSLGRKLGYSGTVISKYLSGVPEGDVPSLETRIEDFLKAAARRAVRDVPPFETAVTRAVHVALECTRRTDDVALLSGPAGIGKSVGIRTYVSANPLTIAITVTRWSRDDAGVVRLLWDELETSSWSGQVSRARYMEQRLADSQRLIVVDNAHRLSNSARAWLFDFHDVTGCPIALVGNPEVLAAIRLNDQQFSRIGLHRRLDMAGNPSVADYARRMVDAMIPDAPQALYALAARVAAERGHLRALRKQLAAAIDLAAAKAYSGDLVRAFADAHALSVRDYEL